MLTKLINLIPPQYKAVAVAAVVAGIFALGWTVNGWRLGSQLSDLDNDLRTCEGNVKTYAEAVVSQNQAIANAKREAERRQNAAKEALRLAQSESSTLEAEISRLRGARGKTCDDAEQLINEALGL